MEKDQIVILKDRGLISLSGQDVKDFLQNILSNDIEKVSWSESVFSAIFTPQGKYLYEFFIIKSNNGYFLDCENEFTKDIISHLSKYKLRSKVEIEDLSSDHVIGIINLDKFKEIQDYEKKETKTLMYRDSSVFTDPRNQKLGARILSKLEKLHLTIKKLNLKIIDDQIYIKKAFALGIPIKGTANLKDQLFGLEANLDELKAIDFKKGCYVGQENTARMKLKNKIRKKLMPINCDEDLSLDSEILYENKSVGKIIIAKPYPFALIKMFDPDFSSFKDSQLKAEAKNVKITIPAWINL